MDNVAISRRKHNIKKGNKENAQPAYESKSFIKRDVSKTTTSLAPLHQKSNEKDTVAKNGQKAKPKQGDMKVKSGEALKKVKTTQKEGAATVAKKQTLSQAFLTEQAARQRKFVAEAPKPPAAVPPSKSALGLYKGKIVQSKIGSIWKSSVAVGGTNQKPPAKASAPKMETQKVGNLTKNRSKSVADLPGRDMQKHQPTRSNSVSDGPPPVSRRPVTSHHAAGVRTALPPARSIPAAHTGPTSSNTTSKPKGKGTQSSKPKMPVVTDKVNKPPVSSTLSQYRVTMETAEERRAKLAEWLASKGRTLKRPTMASAAPPKTKVAAKPEVHLKSQLKSQAKPQPALQRDPKPEPSLDGHRPGSPAAQPEENQRPQEPAHNSTPLIMNSTLDLLDNSDMDLPVDPEARMNDIVVNLCDVLEAMATPSACEDDKCNDGEMEDSTTEDECQDELKNELPEKVDDEPEDVEVKIKAKVEMDDEEVKSDEDNENDVMETTPKMEEASIVKYSVKTTPYLQSVKKTIEGEASACGSRRKSGIKDLKFLTPVRRSCRIQRKSSRLPGMLVDHDPCVSSLAELVKLDDDANAYIYRRNPALLEELPDNHKDF